MKLQTYLSLFLVVLAVLIAFKLAGAIVHYFFWPLVLTILVVLAFFVLRGKNG